MDGSTSKVTVSYWDPSAVYPLFAPDIRARLPLRNLHWKSPSRPLRSINSLHVELNPAVPPPSATTTITEDTVTSPSSATKDTAPAALARTNSNDSSSSFPASKPKTAAAAAIGRTSTGSSSTPNLTQISTKERRHQIPGLRQTPYLKIFFLRCDDNEYYRSTARKQIKEWIGEHCNPNMTSSSSGSGSGSGGTMSKHDNHDAFEWLIVHIVLPGTPAAAQPRLSGQSSSSVNASSTPEASGKSRFNFKSNSTIMEKLKNDFGSSSKKAPNRIVQIRLSHPQPSPPPGAPVPTIPLPTTAEKEADYANLITHMKSLILTSFDLRVLQYEDDITSRSTQQHLPGWNFCTFFVLKEGLAGAFESVGLIEDAGLIYQELSVAGEGIIVGEEADREGGKTFLGWSGEVVKTLVEEGRKWHTKQKTQAESQNSLTVPGDAISQAILRDPYDHGEFDDMSILSSTRKPYRELILSNNISVFDFLSYVFSRQASLLLRLAARLPLRSSSMSTHPATRDSTYSFYDPTNTIEEAGAAAELAPREGEAGYLAEVVKKGIEFLRTGSAVLRAELYRGWESMQADLEQIKQSEAATTSPEDGSTPADPPAEPAAEQESQDTFDLTLPLAKTFIDNYIASFVVNGVMQLLDATDHKSVPHLDREDLLLSDPKSPPPTPGITLGFASGNNKTLAIRDLTSELVSQTQPQTIYSADAGDDESKKPSAATGSAGTEELAFVRAEALMLARGVVVEVAGDRWRTSQEKLHPAPKPGDSPDGMVEISLEDAPADKKESETEKPIVKDEWLWLWGVREGMLRYALGSDSGFLAVYERMTETALKLFSQARRVKSTERTLAEIACIKYYQRDFSTAAHYLSKLTPSYTSQRWTLVEENLLIMYADCLKKMGRDDEFGKVILVLLKKRAEEEKMKLRTQRSSVVFLNGVIRDVGNEDGLGRLPGIQELSKLVGETELGFDDFWAEMEVEGIPTYEEGGSMKWSVALICRWLLKDSITLQSGTMKIEVEDEKVKGMAGVAKEIELATAGDVVIKRGENRIIFYSNTFYTATYEVISMKLKVNNLTFTHRFTSDISTTAAGTTSAQYRRTEPPKVILYQPPETIHVELKLPSAIQLDKVRTVDVEVNACDTIVQRVEMKIKSLTAGLRLLVSDMQLINQSEDTGSGVQLDVSETGVIRVGRKGEESEKRLERVMLRIPYKSDGDLTELSLRVEANLTTPASDNSQYVYVTTPVIPVSLPLSVNVQDIFTRSALFSKFQVSTVNHIPLRIISTELEGSKAFRTATGTGCGGDSEGGIIVYTKQPAGFTFKTMRIYGKEEFAADNLYLRVVWRGIGDEILLAVKKAFAAHISNAGYKRYQELLIPSVENVVKNMDKVDVERAALISAVKLPPFDKEMWTDALAGISPKKGERVAVSTLVEEFFLKWAGRRRIPLLPQHASIQSGDSEDNDSESNILDSLARTIVIPVEIPTLQCLATARLHLDISTGANGGQKMVKAGEMVKAKLKISISRCWDLGKKEENGEVPEKVKFYYEMTTSSEASGSSSRGGKHEEWLINGRRRGVFEYAFPKQAEQSDMAEDEKEVEFEIFLVPLKPGFLLLPGVEVRALPHSSVTPGVANDPEGEKITVSCETDYRSGSEGVLVVHEVEEKIVKVDEMSTLGGGRMGQSRRPVSAGGD